MNFLPANYETPTEPSKYMKLQEGENTFRVLGPAIVGYEWWTDKDGNRVPNRTKNREDVPKLYLTHKDWKQKARFFWAFPVWNYKDEMVQILEVTQKKIIKGIEGLVNSPKWGNPTDYDLVVTKDESGERPDYSVQPDPKEELTKGIQEEWSNTNVRLEALYIGEDPFDMPVADDNPVQAGEVDKAKGEEVNPEDVPF